MSDSIAHPANLEEFKAALDNAGDKLVICDFTASWCGPCRRIAPQYEALAAEKTDLVFLKVDVDEAADVAQQEEIRAMPTFVFYKNGSRVAETTGANIDNVKEKIEANA
eukprot:NODE_2847_length_459_cov_119.529268_g2251_i0.p1 GENE.NODE_2847_length_459_cov_119.529268_g2251_i0~~NODE_2847_length_459_cov_119.529268_g2251_i0.p1  ORF type:complete len:109 (-),score=39.90 NODE_2847_length_459_cov_119.529268_g2251_i0:63-389(-)